MTDRHNLPEYVRLQKECGHFEGFTRTDSTVTEWLRGEDNPTWCWKHQEYTYFVKESE